MQYATLRRYCDEAVVLCWLHLMGGDFRVADSDVAAIVFCYLHSPLRGYACCGGLQERSNLIEGLEVVAGESEFREDEPVEVCWDGRGLENSVCTADVGLREADFRSKLEAGYFHGR